MSNIFKGLITALITPFKGDQIDFDALEKIVRYQIDNKVDGIVVGGSTGEGSSLSLTEYEALLKSVVDIAQKNLPIIAGCSAVSTKTAVDMVKICSKISLDGLMCSIPAYVKPTQDGIYKHFEAIHDASTLPIMLYSVPSRTIVDFTDATIFKLAKLPRIIALKDADKDLERPLRIQRVLGEFNLVSGNDEIALSYNAQGGVGCVSVVSNIVPSLCKKLQDSCRDNKYQEALQIQQRLLPLYKALFAESNPIGVKYAAQRLGLCSGELRLPLTTATDATKEKIDEIITLFLDSEKLVVGLDSLSKIREL